MTVRLTEKSLPLNTAAVDLGQAEGDAAAALISYYSSPLATGQQQTYVVMVLDAGLQGTVTSFEWSNGATTLVTERGVLELTHETEGSVQISVKLRDAGNTVLKTISMTQIVAAPNADLEALINAQNASAPTASDPETSREIINNVRGYIDEMISRTADAEGSLNHLLFAIAYAEAMLLPSADRAAQLDRLSGMLEDGNAQGFAAEAVAGIGLCQVRPDALGMYLSTTGSGNNWYIARQEMPHDPAARQVVRDAMTAALAALDEAKRVSLFNLLRFPKSNLNMAMILLERLREQYYAGQALPSILADENKIRMLVTEYKEGPFALT